MARVIESRADLTGVRVLVVDDEADLRSGLCKLIETLGADVQDAEDGVEALRCVDESEVDLVLTDLTMPRMGGAELLVEIKRREPDLPVVILTGFGTIQGAVSSLQNGAAHFMTKPFENGDVLSLVSRLGRQVLANRDCQERTDTPQIVAEDPQMVRVMQLVDRVAGTPVPVLVEGESGTGKEVIAQAIHDRSRVRSRPFLAVNAAALPDSLLEAELFGTVRGAFTGADRDRKGIFREVDGGTVFLDELPSMSLSFQGKLLRVLQEKVVRPVGGSREVPVEFRLITASNRDLFGLVEAGVFREDLYYRLRVVHLQLPPLRDRPRDIPLLAASMLRRAANRCLGEGAVHPTISMSAQEALEAYRWPGNVRELDNAMQRAVVVCAGPTILPHHLGLDSSAPSVGDESDADVDYARGKSAAIERFQREFIQRALEGEGGNISRTAVRCGLTRAALQRILRQLEISASDFKRES